MSTISQYSPFPSTFSTELIETLLHIEELEEEFEMELETDFAPNSSLKKVRLWSIPRTTGQLLHSWVASAQPQTIVECGTSAGYSTLWLAAAAAQYGGHVYTIDSSAVKTELAWKHIVRAGLQEYITIIQAPIADALQKWNQPIDMVFFDADKKNTLSFLNQIEKKLTNEAMIIVDDVLDIREPMIDFIEYMHQSPDYSYQEFDIDHGIGFAKNISFTK